MANENKKAEKLAVTPVAVDPTPAPRPCAHASDGAKCKLCARECVCGHTFGEHFTAAPQGCAECVNCTAFREAP